MTTPTTTAATTPTSGPASVFTFAEHRRLLARTPDALHALLDGAADDVLDGDEGEGTWSPRQVVGHLVDAEHVNWIPRVRVYMEHPGGAFPNFDRFARLPSFAGQPIDALLAQFREARRASLETLAQLNIADADLERTAVHPEFGVVTLRQQLSTWVAHDLAHLTQLTRVMAKRYVHDVGPWTKYLSVFRQRGSAGG